MTIKKPKIKWYEIMLSFAFMTFYLPSSYALPSVVHKLWEMSLLLVSSVACIFFFVRRSIRVNSSYFVFAMFYAWLYLGTGFFSETGSVAKTKFIQCLGFITLLELSFYFFSKKSVAKSFLISGLLMCLIHFLSFLKYSGLEGGMRHGETYVVAGRVITNSSQNWYFLTYDNDSIFYFLPIAALLLYYYYNFNKSALKVFILYIGFILYMFISKVAATALISMLLFTILVIYYIRYETNTNHNKKTKIKLDYKLSIYIGILFSIFMLSIVGGGLATKIGSYFGKDGSFSGRDRIWAAAMKLIKDRPIVGYGIEPLELVWNKLGQTHCHNIFLELLYTGGIIALIMFFLVVYMYRPKKNNTFSSYIFAVAMLCYMIASGVDFLYTNPIPMSLFYFTHYFSDEKYIIKRGVI